MTLINCCFISEVANVNVYATLNVFLSLSVNVVARWTYKLKIFTETKVEMSLYWIFRHDVSRLISCFVNDIISSKNHKNHIRGILFCFLGKFLQYLYHRIYRTNRFHEVWSELWSSIAWSAFAFQIRREIVQVSTMKAMKNTYLEIICPMRCHRSWKDACRDTIVT